MTEMKFSKFFSVWGVTKHPELMVSLSNSLRKIGVHLRECH